uniref:Gag-Pol polyprotein n=1 Tax=Tanacetum cinerariifolium TaxID=118510 RepID=A0A6L2JH78_TANCI|nr:hypothetical protein [Tanacetum cinerariifolium]
MSTQQDISSRRMIPEPGDANQEVPVNETFHEQTDDELTEKELKQVKANDQAIQTILLSTDIGIQEKKAKLFTKWERFTSTDGESIESYYHYFSKLINDFKRNKHFPEKIASNLKFLKNLQPKWSRNVTIVHQTKDLHAADYTQLYDFLKYNQKENYVQQPMQNPEDIIDPTTAINMELVLMAKAFKLDYSTPTNNNQRISSNPHNRQIAQPGMNMGQDKQMQMVGCNGGNQNAVQNPGVQNVRNQNGLIVVLRIANQNPSRNGNVVAARAEDNAIGNNGIQLQSKEFDLMAAAAGLDEIEEVNANYILMASLQQASTSGTQTDKALVYDSDGSAKECLGLILLSLLRVDTTAKTKRPQPRSNTKNDRVPSASKSSCSKNKEVKVKDHPRNLLLSKNKKHMSSECNNVKLATRNVKSKVVCAMFKQCLISDNHDFLHHLFNSSANSWQ